MTAVASPGGSSPGPNGTPSPPGAEHRLGPLEQIPRGEGRAFAVGRHQVAVFRLKDGSLRALSALCPHKGGPIADGQIDDRIVLCPLHLNAFDLSTGCSTTGAEPLRSYPVRTDDTEIVLVAD